jgi:hypothetical protein
VIGTVLRRKEHMLDLEAMRSACGLVKKYLQIHYTNLELLNQHSKFIGFVGKIATGKPPYLIGNP